MQLLRSSLNKGATRHGAYGTITGARSFICAATNKEAASLLQVGYMMEDVVLFLTLLGLDTCWMAGTFSQTKFRSAAQVAPDEILPIVTEVSKPGLIRNPVDFLINPTQGIHGCLGNTSSVLMTCRLHCRLTSRANTPQHLKWFAWRHPPPTSNFGAPSGVRKHTTSISYTIRCMRIDTLTMCRRWT